MVEIINRINQRASNYKLLEVKTDKKDKILTTTFKFLNTDVLIIEYDSEKEIIKTLVVKGIQGLNESISYTLLDLLDEFPEMNTDEFEKLSKFEKVLHYVINTSGIILNQVSLSNSNLFMKLSDSDTNLLLMLPDSSMVALSSIKKTEANTQLNIPPTVYGILSKTREQNQIMIQILESIKIMVSKGEELGFYDKKVSRMFLNNIELLLSRIHKDSRLKLLKSLAVTLSKIALALTVIYLFLSQFIH